MPKEKKAGKFQFVFLNLDGDDDTIREAVRQAGAILSRGLATQPATSKTLIAIPVQKALGDGGSNGAPIQQQMF